MPMKTGDVIWSSYKSKGTWWYVWGEPVQVCDYTTNSVLVAGEFPSGFEGGWAMTFWDDETIHEQGARIVPDDEVPDEVWARIALWRLTR